MQKLSYIFFLAIFSVLFIAPHAFAHVIVKPVQAGIASYQTFSVGVPTEKDNPTVGLRLIIPIGVKSVTPNVKTGWDIKVIKNENDKDAQATEIDWTGGSIPPGQRDDFVFSAQVPSKETTLIWKAYQTYQNGEIVGWVDVPGKEGNGTDFPYSITTVINDLKQTPVTTQQKSDIPLGTIAIALSAVAIAFSLQRRK